MNAWGPTYGLQIALSCCIELWSSEAKETHSSVGMSGFSTRFRSLLSTVAPSATVPPYPVAAQNMRYSGTEQYVKPSMPTMIATCAHATSSKINSACKHWQLYLMFSTPGVLRVERARRTMYMAVFRFRFLAAPPLAPLPELYRRKLRHAFCAAACLSAAITDGDAERHPALATCSVGLWTGRST